MLLFHCAWCYFARRSCLRWAAGVAYKIKEAEWVAFHTAMPFGATASVYAWHRVGALISSIARRLFKMIIYRYVDDYFSAERSETAEHSMQIFARLVRMLLGSTSVSKKKLEWGRKLQVLGMMVTPQEDGIRLKLIPEKASKWCALIDEALASKHLTAGEAEKLSGRLMWGTQHFFHRCSRSCLYFVLMYLLPMQDRPRHDQADLRANVFKLQFCREEI